MCAIVGIADLRGGARAGASLVAAMTATLAHRGPDGSCVAMMGAADGPHLTFGFRRLAILDLGSGARDYADESGRLRAICNGEIYNAPEIRKDLVARGHRLETSCDTEVIPHLYEEHGLDFVSRLNGMFAFAIFDARGQRLVLGRDRAARSRSITSKEATRSCSPRRSRPSWPIPTSGAISTCGPWRATSSTATCLRRALRSATSGSCRPAIC